jgi:interferon gamma-inducible protein 30
MVDQVAFGNTKMNPDGSFTCQHGEGECESDILHSCVQYKLANNLDAIATGEKSFEAWPFILCMELAEGDPAMGESCYQSSMSNSSVSWSTIDYCATNEGNTVQTYAAKATPSHDYVPWVLVDNIVLEHTNLLLKAICDAYTGVPPSSCSPFSAAKERVCMNSN